MAVHLYELVVLERALPRLDQAMRRWRDTVGTSLFADELAAAYKRIRAFPGSGWKQKQLKTPGVLCVLLPGSGYRLYYSADDATRRVFVWSLWHMKLRPPRRV
jgi:hypothetical protein